MNFLAFRRVLTHWLSYYEARFWAAVRPSWDDYHQPAVDLAFLNDDVRPAPSSTHTSILETLLGGGGGGGRDAGLLWAVPTKRRSIERNLTRRWDPSKRVLPKRNLLMCPVCGHYHEAHTICGNCYDKVRQETQAMQEAVMDSWQLDPVDKEVVVLYENDDKTSAEEEEKEFWKGKRIVEMKKERPLWFHQNLKVPTRPSKPGETSVQRSKTILTQVK